jgi:hypothetical protein
MLCAKGVVELGQCLRTHLFSFVRFPGPLQCDGEVPGQPPGLRRMAPTLALWLSCRGPSRYPFVVSKGPSAHHTASRRNRGRAQ